MHGFIRMAQLALLVFDEGTLLVPSDCYVKTLTALKAHHARAEHPASRIMRDFYHPHSSDPSDDIPDILGLTASPVINSKPGSLQ